MQEKIIEQIQHVIEINHLNNWLTEHPWLTGFLGDLSSPIWFVGENPSLLQVENKSKKTSKLSDPISPNLQWNTSAGDFLLREALTEADLITINTDNTITWNCYITNAIKQPEFVSKRNKKKSNSSYWKIQAENWLPVLQLQIELGNPRVLIAFGNEVVKILNYMKKLGLTAPPIEKVHHYSYIMLRPEARSSRGPKNPERIMEFKKSIIELKEKYFY